VDRCVTIEQARFVGGLNLVGMNTGVVTARRTIGRSGAAADTPA
jgi:hypothetical protein